MTATRSQVLNGLAEFVQREVLPTITDIPIKLVVGTLLYRLRNIPDSFNALIFDNPAVRLFIVEAEDGIDVDATLNGLASSLQSYGNLVLTIPSIPLVSKQEHTMSFSGQDIDKLKQYITGGIR